MVKLLSSPVGTSPEIIEKCKHVIKTPTKFCLNVQIAGAIVMYDRIKSFGTFSKKPDLPGGADHE